jgi:hypothetical protein
MVGEKEKKGEGRGRRKERCQKRRRNILGRYCSASFVVAVYTDKRCIGSRKVSHWLERQAKLRHATNTAGSRRRTRW